MKSNLRHGLANLWTSLAWILQRKFMSPSALRHCFILSYFTINNVKIKALSELKMAFNAVLLNTG